MKNSLTTWDLLVQESEIETDHKPLILLLKPKALDNLPPRVLQFCLRLARYQYITKHVPGKLLFVAERAPVSQPNTDREQVDVLPSKNQVLCVS